jgi:uncharacterized protein
LQGIANHLSVGGLKTTAIETAGSIENIRKLEGDTSAMGTVFIGTAAEALSGSAPWTQGRTFPNLRALFPMYETSFQLVAMRSSGISSLSQLAGKRVGVGPAGGPAESFLKGLLQEMRQETNLVAGTPAELASALQRGTIDALWQGAVVPIPVIKQIADASDVNVFGLSAAERQLMLRRYPFLAEATVAPNRYRGQSQEIRSVAAWNFVLVHRDFPQADAYWITRTVLSLPDPAVMHPSAASTRMSNAVNNSVVPFHDGAMQFYREQGVAGTLRPHVVGK